MPIITPQEIEAGFEQRVPTPDQAQRIQDVRAQLILAAEFVALRLNDNRQAELTIRLIQQAFSTARTSIMLPSDNPGFSPVP